MIQAGREVRSRTDYILGTDHRLFWNVSVRYPRNNSDHYMILGCLHSASLREKRKWLSLRPHNPDKGGWNLRGPTEGRPKAEGTGPEEKRVDLGGHVENC